jgi:hypothetical protein
VDHRDHLTLWSYLRQFITYSLGVMVVLDAVITSGTHVTEIDAGLVLLGIVPVDAFLSRLPLRSHGDE